MTETELRKSIAQNEGETVGVKETAAQRVDEKVIEKVTDNQRTILELVQQNPRMTQLQLSEKIGISRRHIASNIRALAERGLIRRVGPDKGGRWEVGSQ